MASESTMETFSHYIDGQWYPVPSATGSVSMPAINPADSSIYGKVSLGDAADLDKAVIAARKAFPEWSTTPVESRIETLEALIIAYKDRFNDLVMAVSTEMGAPVTLAQKAQVPSGLAHLKEALRVLKTFHFEQALEPTQLRYEPVGVCGLITPWNWPLNQIACKVAPALATGCTMILKPSELAPWSARIFAEIVDSIGLPSGVFNLVYGIGETLGSAMAAHQGLDMISITGSTRAGRAVAQQAATNIKRVTQELGGKSAWLILPDADLSTAVKQAVRSCFSNSGQSCDAPTRLLVPSELYSQTVNLAQQIASQIRVGDPADESTQLGPIANENQYNKVRNCIQRALNEGAQLLTGGLDLPANCPEGFFVQPTIFVNVSPDMSIAREEVFGPVLAILSYESVGQAIDMANDSEYGLAAYISGNDHHQLHQVARRLRTGMVHLNGAMSDIRAPFGGYKQSGNGREWGIKGFEDYLEVKSIFGFYP